MTVTVDFSSGRERGVDGVVAGRSVLGYDCSLGGRSGSGDPHVRRDRGNSDALCVKWLCGMVAG